MAADPNLSLGAGMRVTCRAWCPLFGLIVGPMGLLPNCSREPGHEGDHETNVAIYAEPGMEARISWRMT